MSAEIGTSIWTLKYPSITAIVCMFWLSLQQACLLKSLSMPLSSDSFPSSTPVIQSFFFYSVPQFLCVPLLCFVKKNISCPFLIWSKSSILSLRPDILSSVCFILLVRISFEFPTWVTRFLNSVLILFWVFLNISCSGISIVF